MGQLKKKKSVSRSESKLRLGSRKEKKLVCTSCRKAKSPSQFGKVIFSLFDSIANSNLQILVGD